MKSAHLVPILSLVLFSNASAGERFDLSKRASEIDERAKEHPAIDFVFTDDKGKPRDLQHASVDTDVKSEGKLVIWLMDHNAGLAERVNSYGMHYLQVSYATATLL